ALHSGPVQVVGEPGRPVRRVAVVCGAGGEILGDAVRARADVLLTGETRFHDYLAARAAGLALVLPGHYATERGGVEDLAGRLRARVARRPLTGGGSMSELKRILLVEDSPNDVELTLTALAENHLANEVVVARDGEEALDYLYRRGIFKLRSEGHPAVVLLD